MPLAHTEAPSLGSIVLAGILLKLGSYGLIIILIIFIFFLKIFFFFVRFIGIFFRRIICSLQRDGKVLIAYSSVTHINFGILCIIFFFLISKKINFLITITHGIVASLIF